MDKKYLRILAVDDEKLILDLMMQTLGSSHSFSKGSEAEHHYNLSVFQQGPEAVEAVQMSVQENQPFSVAFIDIHMPPRPDGVWTAKRIRDLDSDICIVLVTGFSGIDLLEMTRRIPPPDKLLYVEKPFLPQEIWQFAHSLSARWQAERELRAIRSGLEDMVEERTSALLRANEQLKTEIENRSRADTP